MSIDTLKLHLSDYDVSQNCKLTVQPAPFCCETGALKGNFLLFENVEGQKAYFNDDFLQVDLAPTYSGEIGCWVKLSVPKVYHKGSNYHSVGKLGTQAVLKVAEKKLEDIGIKTNINKSKVIRLDTFKNIQTEEPFPYYSPVLSHLEAKRQNKRDYGTTFLWHNTQQEICVYDKLHEMEYRKHDVSTLPKNTMRFEYRLLKGKKVNSVLGTDIISDIVSEYGSVKEAFEKAMSENIFRYNLEDFKVRSVDLHRRQLEAFVHLFNDRWLSNYIKYKSSITEDPEGLVKAVRELMLDMGKDKHTVRVAIYRLRKHLQEVERIQTQVNSAMKPNNKKTNVTLYKEMRTKVLSNVA